MRWARARVRRGLGRVVGRGQSLAPARVLVADDDDVIRQFITVHLTAAGFTVIPAASGAEALALAAHSHVQVTVLDAGMPPPNGWEVARQLRADRATAGIRTVVMWSAGSHGGSQAESCGPDACLAKPFSPPELVALVLDLTRPLRLSP
jgi:CheY-like chemotaxis protein